MKNLISSLILFVLLLAVAVPVLATTYEVGDGKPYTSISAVPWQSLAAGDTVNIYYRSTAYKEKFPVGALGTSGQPILIHGVPDGSGNLPVIDGQSATTSTSVSTGSEARGLITMQQWTTAPPSCHPSYITIENLEFKNSSTPYTFKDDTSATVSYVASSAAIWITDCRNVTVRNCYMHDCGNGFFTYTEAAGADCWTQDVLVEGNYITACGNSGSNTEHDSYCESYKITYQYNHYGPPRGSDTQAIGNALKDRSAGMVARYNWIDGGNRTLDLVDAEDSSTLYGEPEYQKTFVYGNVLIERNDAGNSQVVHWGWDNSSSITRQKCYFYNNTVVSLRTGGTVLFMSTGTNFLDCRNNLIYMTAAGSTLQIVNDSTCPVNMTHNWLKPGYVLAGGGGGTVNDDGTSVTGSSPGFVNESGQDYHLASGSQCINAGTTLHADCSSYPVSRQYVKHQSSETRPSDGTLDIGAFEYGSTALTITTTGLPAGTVGTAYSQTLQASGGTTPYTWSLQSGSLPAGLSLGSSTGTISGTPTTAGTSNFTAKVTDNVGATATKALSIVINAPATLTITTTGLPNGVVGGAYSQTLQATGGVTPYTWSLQSGSLPGGLSLNASSGVISGTPTATGTSNFTAKVTDSQATPATATKALSIIVTTEPTYQFSASDSEASTTSTSYQTKATLTFTPGSVDDWVIFGFAEYKGSSTSYSALVKMQVDGADQAVITVEPKDTTDYQSFATLKVANLSAASHTVTIQYASENTGATAYIRNARVVAVKKASLEMASNAADSAVALTTTLTNYVTTSFTPATAGDYLLLAGAEFNGATTSYSTEVQAKLGSTVLDDSLVEAKDTTDYGAFFSASVVNCPASAQSLTVTAAKESGSSATHYIRRARAVAIRLSGSRFTGYQSAAADSVSTTTSTSFQNKATKSWSVTTAGDWLMLGSFRVSISNATYSNESRVQVDDTTTSAQPLRECQDTTDYMNCASVDVRNLSVASHFVDVDYRSENAAATAGIEYAHIVAIPLSGGGGVADLVITTTSVPNGQIGVAYSQTLVATGGVTPYTWSVLSGSLPGGLSLGSSTGTISGTPTTAGTSNFTVRVTDSQGTPDTDDQALSIVIPPDLTITTTGLAGGQVNVAYSQSLAASGGVTPYSWSLASGSLPAGLTLSTGGVISGTPTAAGTSNFTVRVTDSQSPADSATKALSIVIAPPVLTITTTSVPNGQIGVAYSQTVQAVGGTTPYTWSVSGGSLPAGLSLGSSTGTISGTPTTAGTSNFTVRVTDNVSATDDQALSIAIPADLTVTTASLPNGTVGTAYSQTLAASGGVTPYSWSLASGSLPAGLTLSSGGVISGTPTAYGTSNFTARVTDSQTPADTATKALSIVVAPADLVITTTGLPNGTVGTAYSQTLAATGGVTPYTWSVYSGTLPAGLSLGSSTGTISGTPTTAGTSNFTIRVTDSQGTPDTYDKALSIIVVSGGGSYNVTFQDGVNGYTGTRDNWLNSDSPDTNNGTVIQAHLQYNTQDRQIHLFDVSSIPSNATITSATISFYVWQVSGGTPNVSCYRILKQWDELQSTYNSRLTGTAWGTPGLLSGTDYAATAIATSGNISAAGWANFTITSTVQAWVNGSQTNYGVMYKESSAGHLYTRMREYTADTTVRPKLVVSYTTP